MDQLKENIDAFTSAPRPLAPEVLDDIESLFKRYRDPTLSQVRIKKTERFRRCLFIFFSYECAFHRQEPRNQLCFCGFTVSSMPTRHGFVYSVDFMINGTTNFFSHQYFAALETFLIMITHCKCLSPTGRHSYTSTKMCLRFNQLITKGHPCAA